MRDETRARRAYWVLWVAILLLKLAVAARLPLFVDEAFYWQEGRHLAAAYSDLPGLTAWLTRLGVALGGEHALALRLPFLLIAAAVPWLVVAIAAREYGATAGWQAGGLALLLPLAGTLGLLALPDAAMALATLLCLDAGARLLRGVDAAAALELAFGLALGALCHYRFIAVIGVGGIVLLLLPEGRRLLRDVRVLVAVAIGASAWAPLVAWNFDNADAGLRFQLIDRHPWAFHFDGALFLAIQGALVTPLLFAALAWAAWRGLRSPLLVSRFFALFGALVVLGFFVLGFFADTERVSFHWPLPGYLALLPLLPNALAAWPRAWRRATWGLAGAGLAASLGYYVAVSSPHLRERASTEKWYPANFAGWDRLAEAVRAELAAMPPGTRIVADNFKLGAELGFALGDPRIPVLDHPLNHKHGRAPQLRLWGLHSAGRADWGEAPVLLVVSATEVPFKHLLRRYHALCAMVGPLPPPRRVLNVDHGRQRFLLFALEGPRREGPCAAPAIAWIDEPVSAARVGRRFAVRGWAFKDGAGLAAVEITLDGDVVATARYGRDFPGLQRVWTETNDPQHPKVGFDAEVDLAGRTDVAPGRHWLGLRLHGRDGSVEAWSEQPLELGRE
ncbi:ArnT family glycosyltransferase [Vulcaniibacterium tengchongense]|uniref:4-amino-4-deoxy-L-arabinose transferase-like glycosyltransferase n=1 Tax=Vulcaniibacterium tengchongense TaxID=1273429 RepID=A0A3N4W7Q3_9GAMM|nr:glycosyltransferase family 39 protein [Vulcaniibacterium tengchongense]RPE81254.1 4-amino-4-deoxy-L-arabinose transferase-like glycosyltransferase [Vulcaniibacterium tengchongense]